MATHNMSSGALLCVCTRESLLVLHCHPAPPKGTHLVSAIVTGEDPRLLLWTSRHPMVYTVQAAEDFILAPNSIGLLVSGCPLCMAPSSLALSCSLLQLSHGCDRDTDWTLFFRVVQIPDNHQQTPSRSGSAPVHTPQDYLPTRHVMLPVAHRRRRVLRLTPHLQRTQTPCVVLSSSLSSRGPWTMESIPHLRIFVIRQRPVPCVPRVRSSLPHGSRLGYYPYLLCASWLSLKFRFSCSQPRVRTCASGICSFRRSRSVSHLANRP
ncbi:hypothetical protein B0T17DRAFT_262876 [Bombardia bombarda]|uniref:Uncharacterized protein n=1 Tax=Bombardia bombarda TaxID=252184 RepID=A0AA40C565_9PEZI|nr:hypothetical protein B0T17DRAFT_262876 [Bombardia bombarda]